MPRRLLAGCAAALALAACGGDASAPKATGAITVFAASSLTGAFGDIGRAFETANPRTKVTFNFAASSALAQQIGDGAPADVFASADTKALHGGVVFARNRLVIVTKPGNPARVHSLADLAHAGVVSLCGAEVPCGAYAAAALRKANVTLDESKVTRGQNVAATLTAVSEGDAVAGVVYATDAKAAGGAVTAVAIPAADNVVATYPIRALDPSAAARGFVAFVRGTAGQRILKRYGFITT
ncbi:MAG TPA: molybdate ABC transporter substrate-binding protein [Acidimicrobiales bacterium]|nr:molybdate ABC transporter substrate-binding protein [Acidimicrobiales bacterium]